MSTTGNGETRATITSLSKEVYDNRTSIEVLKSELQQSNMVHKRLDTAIDKLTNISSGIKSMLAVHEEKLNQAEKLDEIIFSKLKDRQEDTEARYRQLKDNIDMTEKRIMNEIRSIKNSLGEKVNMLEKWKYLIIGGSIVIGFILARNFPLVVELMKVS
jgi:chromosome segregation ATPase|tara:strand:- start:39 stop:515 length:477 start_codon:yes stop_codon:yes gene_type:complete